MNFIFFSKIQFYLNQIRKGKIKIVLKALAGKIYSKKQCFVLMRDTNTNIKSPRTLLELNIRGFIEEDEIYFNQDNENTALIKRLPKCYVATNRNNVPCFRTWLLDSKQNLKIREFWGNSYPELKKNEALIESTFTIPKYRGLGVMPRALSLIAEEAKKDGIQFIYAIVPLTNINSLTSCYYSGFLPHKIKTVKHLLFFKQLQFEELADEHMEFYNQIIKRTII